MDTEKIANLCLKILNATDYAEAHGVLEPIDDIDIPSTSRYSCNVADILSPVLLASSIMNTSETIS
jgi:hypothetical protein